MPQLMTIVAGTFATLMWRILGVGIAKKIDEHHKLFEWFSHVSYAGVAAVLVQNLFGSDAYSDWPELVVRFLALISGLGVCRMRADRVFYGLMVALGMYMILDYTQVVVLLWRG